MNKFSLSISFLTGLLLIVFLILNQFDFASMEGRGHEQHDKVKWAFSNGHNINGADNYLLLQRQDPIRNRPRLYVEGRYWLGDNKYLQLNNVSKEAFEGQQCLIFNANNYKLRCIINNGNPEAVCDSSFLSYYEILPPKPSVSDVVRQYDRIEAFYRNFPSSLSESVELIGNEIPEPLQKYKKVNEMMKINCWAEKLAESPNRPVTFTCGEEYNKCIGDSSITIHGP